MSAWWQTVPHHLRVRLLVVLLAGALFWGMVWLNQTGPQLLLLNQSGQMIRRAQFRLAGVSTVVTDLPAGDQRLLPLGSEATRQFQLEGQLADGTRLHSQGQLPEGARRLILLPGGQLRFAW
jgi:hypothetical protein